MTPEGKVKAAIKKVLNEFGVYYFMPVQMGLGAAGLDFHCMVNVHSNYLPVAFFIEAKAPGKVPTARQETLIAKLKKYKAMVFVIKGDDDRSLSELTTWLGLMTDRGLK